MKKTERHKMQTSHNIRDVCDVFCVLWRYVIRPLFPYTGSYIVHCLWRHSSLLLRYVPHSLCVNSTEDVLWPATQMKNPEGIRHLIYAKFCLLQNPMFLDTAPLAQKALNRTHDRHVRLLQVRCWSREVR